MTVLFVALARSVATAGIALLVCAIAGRASAALRHWIVVAGIVASATVVPLSFILPQYGLLPAQSPAEATADEQRRDASAAEFSLTDSALPSHSLIDLEPLAIAAALWIVGALCGLVVLAIRLAHLSRLSASAARLIDSRWREICAQVAASYRLDVPIDLRSTRTPHLVATWGVRQPLVLVPEGAAGWNVAWIRVVLAHELAHIARADWMFQVSADIVRAVLWPNALLWFLCSRLRRESECACDDMVVRGGVAADVYAANLVEIARECRDRSTVAPALPIVGASTLERRIIMLLKSTRDRRLPATWAVVSLLAGMLGLGVTLSSISVFAQTTTGTMTGHVYDSSGAVLPGVEVVLEDVQQTKWPTMTDSSGRFEFSPVGAGKYTLSVSVPGFRTLRDQFTLQNAKDWDRSITMQVGELEETIMVTAQRPAPRPATSAGAAPAPVRVGGNIKPPVKLTNVPPIYPAAMRNAGLEGVVPMEALLAIDGTVASVRMLSAQVHPAFARAAEDAVRQWRFSQTLLNGVPVEVRMTVSVHFGLTD